jgi:hypothetical protein
MKHLLLAIVVVSSPFWASGCVTKQAAVWNRAWRLIEPDYLRYVEADPALNDTQKEMRKQHAALLSLTLKDIIGE